MIVAVGVGILGLVLIYLEFFVPGGILAVLGGLAMIISVFLFVWESGSYISSLIFVIASIALLIFTIRFALWKIKQKPALYASDDQSGFVASSFDHELVGKTGEALTNLKPSGHVLVEGKRHQAVSESSYIKKGESVIIVGGEGARLTCRRS
ncbi:MAG: serine protease [Simkaniaceae bacterium]|nr:serine protease [Simkaniaceae bacterium]